MKPICLIAIVGTFCCYMVSCSRDKDAAILRRVIVGDTNALALHLNADTNISRPFRYGSVPDAYASLLHIAVERGHIEVARLLLGHRADVNARDSHGRTPLMWVTGLTENDVEPAVREKIMTLLLREGANPDLQDSDGETPLIWASEFGKSNMVRILLDAGAKVNLTDRNGYSALHVAKTPEVAILLLKAGADINAKSNSNETPIETAIREKRFSVLSVLTNQSWSGVSHQHP